MKGMLVNLLEPSYGNCSNGGAEMDQSAKKIVNEFESLRRERIKIDTKMAALKTALEVMGIRFKFEHVGIMDSRETTYIDQKPFTQLTLSQSCLKILTDHRDAELDKNQVEYLLTLGGYPFAAKDPTNSVEIALRKLATEKKCSVEKKSGPHGSAYKSNGYQETREDVND